jgi:release factor glutamine methyltransferase
VGSALAEASRTLAGAGSDTPRLDAELLLAEVLDPAHPDRARLVVERDAPIDPATVRRFAALVARREAREPIAYILGRRAFRRLTLSVDPRVLIPRPETELLVEVALTLHGGAVVADVGTGSGAVALALKDERPDLVVRGTDASEDALAVARANGARLGLDVAFAVADLFDGDPADAVVANLPYVADGAALPPEVARYEPAGALFAGADGLDLVRRLIAQVAAAPVSMLALEIGPEQGWPVARLMRAAGFDPVDVLRDLAGLERVVTGSR